MKKAILFLTAVCLLVCMAMPVFAADGGVEVYVTVSDGSGLTLARELVSVTDTDGDGAVSIADALYCAHEKKYEGGAAAGFAAEETEYGLSMNRLWGVENGGSYGYYLNNTAALSLADPVSAGDHVQAYAYADLNGWSDMFSYFDAQQVSVKAGETVELLLSGVGFDADWNPVTVPVSGAAITVDGVRTEAVTDEAGRVTVKLDKPGDHVISAVSDTQVLVPPVCYAAVSGSSAVLYVCIGAAVVAAAAVVMVVVRKKMKG